MELTPVFVTAIIFGFTYAVIHLLVRRKERMALIQKGEDLSILKNGYKPGFMGLKLGLLFIGVAVGLLLGSVLAETTTLNDESAYFSMIFLFGGIGLVLSHYMEKKEAQELKGALE
jgi:ABC-type Fe3+-siderophore transport system permease subunit